MIFQYCNPGKLVWQTGKEQHENTAAPLCGTRLAPGLEAAGVGANAPAATRKSPIDVSM